MKVIDSYESFKEVIGSEDKVLVDFFANWCHPCKRLEPALEDLSEEMNIKKVDVDESPEIAEKFQVMGLPTLILFQDGEEVNRTTGFSGKSQLKDFYS